MRVCHGFCVEVGIKASRHSKPYSNGLKYCYECGLFICSSDKLCFCCTTHLRVYGVVRRENVHRY